MSNPDDRYAADRGGPDDRDRDKDRSIRRDDDDYDSGRFRKQDVPNYLVPGILVTLFCCLIGGIITIVQASSANTKAAAGDYEGAMKAAENAKTWMWISIIVGAFINIAYIALQVSLAQQGKGF
jgi:hypothetical protein